MVSADRQAQLQPEITIRTTGQRRYDINDLEHGSIQNSHPNGGYTKALFDPAGNLLQVVAVEEFLSGKPSSWLRVKQTPSEEMMRHAVGTTESACIFFISPMMSGSNWAQEDIQGISIGANILSAGNSRIVLSDQVNSRTSRRRDSNLPSVSAVADHLIGAVPCSEEVAEFARGLFGKTPTEEAIRAANTIFKEATGRTEQYDFYVDDSQGSLGFMLRLNSGLLLLAELSPEGTLSGGTYVDNEDESREVIFLPDATVSEMLDLF